MMGAAAAEPVPAPPAVFQRGGLQGGAIGEKGRVVDEDVRSGAGRCGARDRSLVRHVERDLHEALLDSLDIHPDVHKEPHDGLFSFDQNPDAVCWHKGSPTDMALQRRMNEAAGQLDSMSPAQAHASLAKLNQQSINLASGEVLPAAVMQQRLDHYAKLWLQYAEGTNFMVQAWNAWRKKKPWVEDLME